MSKSEIASKAEGLLNECWDGVFPIDIEKLCDYLKIAILPVAGLADNFRIDAFISTDFKTIYADAEKYRCENHRYRFSVAHEIGHYLLHREYFSSRVWSFEEWKDLSGSGVSRVAESQANYFAGSLLAPEGALLAMLNTEFGGSFARNYFTTGSKELKNMLTSLQKLFNVSKEVVSRRIQDTVYGLN
ncbi:ImmA/IrrE family metallo-endopeptidase [Candidatus Saccharibacteria bacterium]|nr:ImmA/IrrE family metallo-endopeptidase [Candidatus Saccharibacteria bacterium]